MTMAEGKGVLSCLTAAAAITKQLLKPACIKSSKMRQLITLKQFRTLEKCFIFSILRQTCTNFYFCVSITIFPYNLLRHKETMQRCLHTCLHQPLKLSWIGFHKTPRGWIPLFFSFSLFGKEGSSVVSNFLKCLFTRSPLYGSFFCAQTDTQVYLG